MRLWEMIYTEEDLQQEIRAKESWRDLYWEECEKTKKLREENRNLKENNDKLKELVKIPCTSYTIDLEKKNKELKEELEKFSEAYKRYRDYEKEELAESCYDFARENDKLKEENNNLKKENSVMKDRLKFWYKWVTREEIERIEKENKSLNKDKDKWKYLYFEEVAKCDKLKAESWKFVKDWK